MPTRQFQLRLLGSTIAASWQWDSASFTIEAVPFLDPPLKFAGTGIRLPTALLTRSGNNFVAGDFAIGMPDYEVSEAWFFFPTFAAPTGGEVLGTSTITIEGMATRSSNGDRTLGTIDDGTAPVVIDPAVTATQNGKWVKFTPASPIAAGATQVFAVAQEISDGTYPNRRISSLGGTSIWGGTVKDERSQGGASSQLSTLSGSANYSNSNGGIVAPSYMLVRTPAGKTAWFVVGDSKGYGADMTIRHQFLTSRHAFSFIDMALDENTQANRIQFSNSCIPGWGFLATSETSSHGNATASARQLWALEKARELNGGRAVADAILCQHGTNSSTAALADQLAGARALASIWRAAIGGDASTPLYWLRSDAYPSSTDGFNTLENQSPSNAAQAFPDGNRWLFSAELADGGDLRTDGTVQDAVDLSNISSAPDPDRDLFKVRPFNTTLAADYSGTGALSFTDEPTLGDYLSFFDGTTTTYGQVDTVTGSGPYAVTIAASVPAYAAADTDIRSTYSGGGLHPGALYHGELAYDADDGVTGLKINLGLVPANSAPVLSDVSISGTAENGATLTANYTVTGFPVPVVTFQWQKNGANISGQTSQTITLNGGTMSLTDGDTISCEITATNSQGSDTEEPTASYVNSGPVTDFLALIDASADSGFFDMTEATGGSTFSCDDQNGGNAFTQGSASFVPGVDATDGAKYDDDSTFVDRVIGSGDYTVTFALKMTVDAHATTVGVLIDPSGDGIEGDATTALANTTLVDGVEVATRQAWYTALNDGAEHTVEIRGVAETTPLRIGRSSVGFRGSIRRIAVIKEADFSGTLSAVRTAAVAAVDAT